ncbi:MAG: methyltransferase domain-containing protein [Actinomycetes bacterium]
MAAPPRSPVPRPRPPTWPSTRWTTRWTTRTGKRRCSTLAPGPGSSRPPSPAGSGSRWTCAWAWISTVVHHLDDLDAVAGELRRVLRPGGLVLVRQAFPGRMGAITLYERFFPGVWGALAATGGLPTVERVSEAFAGAGFRVEGLRAVDQVSATSLAAYRDKVRRRADTGLRLLPDDQFAAGLSALDRAVDAETVPAPVVDRIDLLVLRRG